MPYVSYSTWAVLANKMKNSSLTDYCYCLYHGRSYYLCLFPAPVAGPNLTVTEFTLRSVRITWDPQSVGGIWDTLVISCDYCNPLEITERALNSTAFLTLVPGWTYGFFSMLYSAGVPGALSMIESITMSKTARDQCGDFGLMRCLVVGVSVDDLLIGFGCLLVDSRCSQQNAQMSKLAAAQ